MRPKGGQNGAQRMCDSSDRTQHRAEAAAERARRLWHLDCVEITTLLVHGLTLDELRSALAPHLGECCQRKASNAAWVLSTAQEACQRPNAFSAAVEDSLNARYVDDIAHVREAPLLMVARQLAAAAVSAEQVTGLAWALLTDPCAGKQRLGRQLCHALQLRGAMHAASSGNRVPAHERARFEFIRGHAALN